MKKFLVNIAFIFGILIVCMLLLDVCYTQAFKSGISRNEVQYACNLRNTHIDYIFLGSSRVENHIDCDLITKMTGKSCVNLGIQGSKIGDALGITQILKKNMTTYDSIFFQLDYNYNYTFLTPSVVSYAAPFVNGDTFPEQFKKQMDIPPLWKLPFIRYAENDKMIGFREFMLQLMRKPPAIDLSNGFDPKQGIGQNISGGFPSKLIKNNHYLDELKDITGDRLVLFTAPYCANTRNRDKFMELLQQRESQLKNYIDIFDDTSEYFYNCGHLNEQGATAFTEEFISSLKNKK